MGATAAAAVGMGISSIVGAVGASSGKKYEAAQARARARAGRIQADQIDASYREELTSTINNIRAIRSSSGAAADSPTALAIEAGNERRSDRNRIRDVANRRMQAEQDERDARFLKSSANYALFGGVSSSLASFAEAGSAAKAYFGKGT